MRQDAFLLVQDTNSMADTRSRSKLIRPASRASPSTSSSGDEDDVLPPSMHESLRDGLDDSSEDGEVELKNMDTSANNDSQATLLEEVSLQSEEQAHLLDKASNVGNSKDTRRAQRPRSTTGSHLELKLEQSSLRKRRRRRSSSKHSKAPRGERVSEDN